MVRPSASNRRNSGHVASPARGSNCQEHPRAHSCVRNTPTGRPDWTSIVSSSASVVSVRASAWNDGQSRAPCRSRRRPPGPAVARRRQGRGCCAACAARPPAASRAAVRVLPVWARTTSISPPMGRTPGGGPPSARTSPVAPGFGVGAASHMACSSTVTIAIGAACRSNTSASDRGRQHEVGLGGGRAHRRVGDRHDLQPGGARRTQRIDCLARVSR